MKLFLAVTLVTLLSGACSLETSETRADHKTAKATPTERASDAPRGLEDSPMHDYPMLRFHSPGAARASRSGYEQH